MKKYEKGDETILFRSRMGSGKYKDHEFNLDTLPNGCPVIDFVNEGVMVAFELADLLPMAAREAGLEE